MIRNWKRAAALFMSAALLLPGLPARADSAEEWKDFAAGSYHGGSGTKTSPYEISTPEELALFAKDSNEGKETGKYYILTKDIDLSGKLWNSAGIDADGLKQAVFDGSGNKIKNMKVQAGDQAGFIAYSNASSVINLGLTDVLVKGGDHTGGLIGIAADHTKEDNIIENCYVTGTVNGKDNTGGLIGNVKYDISMDSKSPIRACFSTADVSGENNVGGLVGLCQNAEELNSCFASGNVSAASGRAGGFVGEFQASRVENSFASGDVDGKTEAGGFAGQSKMGTLSGIYAAGKVTSPKAKGGVTATNTAPGSAYENTCYASDTTGAAQAVGNDKKLGKSLTSQDLLVNPEEKLSFPGFADNWTVMPKNGGNGYYPVPKALASGSQSDVETLVKNAVKTEALYKVTFDLNGGKQTDKTSLVQYVKYLGVAKAPKAEKKYCTTSWDKDLTITGDTTIKAVYTPIAVKGIQIKGASGMYSGQSMLLTVTYKPADALPPAIHWEVKGDQAEIDAKGKITAKAPGDVTVKASVMGKEEIFDECTIHIKTLNVHEVEKDLKNLPLKPSYSDRNKILSAAKAYDKLTKEEKKEISSQDKDRMAKSMSALSKILKEKKDVSVSGSLSEGVEIFLEKTDKADSIWSEISEKTEGYLFETGRLYLYDHMLERVVQPDGEVVIKLKTSGDYRNEKNIRIAVQKEDGSILLIKPDKIEKNSVTFRTSYVNSYGVVGDEPEKLVLKGKKTDKTKAKGSGTGDNSQILFYLTACAGAVVIMLGLRKKRA